MTRQVVRFVILAAILGIAWLMGPARQAPSASKSATSTTESARPAANNGRDAPQTWGRPETLADHFARHGADFHARNPEDYAAQAAAFLQKARTNGLPAKRTADGSLRVFDPATGTFAAYNRNGTTKTFFKPGNPQYFERQPGTPVDIRQER